jgi:hypothetical protein
MRTLLLVLLVAGCGHRNAHEICKRASDKYIGCVKQQFGSELAASVKAKEDLGLCERDDKTVAMYEKCLPQADCEGFMACADREASAARASVPANGSRTEQCAQHVKDGLRAIANQVIVIDEVHHRDGAARNKAQRCVLDEAKAWADCVTPDERAAVEAYGKQRQKDCEAWAPEFAACIFRQPGAKNCKPDEEPLWREPRVDGPAGPAASWFVDGVAIKSSIDPPLLAWTADHALVIADDNGVRLVRDGKVVRTADGKLRSAVLVGTYVAGKLDGSGMRIIDLATGAKATALADKGIEALGVVGGKLIAELTDQDLYEITPGTAKTRKLGTVGDESSFTDGITPWHDLLVFTNGGNVRVTDRRGKAVLELVQPDDSTAQLTGDEFAVTEPGRTGFLSLPGCLPAKKLELASILDAPDGCLIVAKRSRIDVAPSTVSHGVATNHEQATELYNDDGTGWKKSFGAEGEIIGDGELLYTTSIDDDGARVLAIERTTGSLAWQTTLDHTTSGDTALALRDGMLAVRVGQRVYALALTPASHSQVREKTARSN